MLLTTSQVKKRLGLSLIKIRRLIELGLLHGINTSTGSRPYYMVPEHAITAFEQGGMPEKTDSKARSTRKQNRRIDASVPKVFG